MRFGGQTFIESRENAIARLDQNNANVRRCERRKIRHDGMFGNFSEGARQFHPCGTACDDGKPEISLYLRRATRGRRTPAGQQDVLSNAERIGQRLQPGRHLLPLVVSNIRVA